jgi:serine/threonine protein kinase
LHQVEGQVFGKYQLLDRIAAGGMAEIYRAKFTGAAGVTKQVVVKKILPHYAGNKNFVTMFINEAKIAVGLSHGNIAQIFDFGEIDGEYFLAMEFVDGQPMSRLLRRMKELQIPVMPTPFAVFVMMETCKALHYAHTRLDETGKPLNIIHRDVSPQNVIVSYEGQVKIVDFGIAKARNASRVDTEAGAVKGKYVYFAPEQARGKDLDSRTDIFSAGVCLYEMVCGRLPFEGRMMEVLGKIVRNDFPKPRTVNPDITPALERIILTAMATEKPDRYPSAQAFQEALAAYLYANAPTFSGGQLANFMSYLYESELVAEGRPVQLPKDFLDQAPLWRKKLPGLDDGADSDGLGPSPKLRSNPPQAPTLDEFDPGDPRRHGTVRELSLISRLPTRWVLGGVPVLAMLVAALVVLMVGHFGTFSVQLTSTPPGAAVEVDNQHAPGLTPLIISNLAADRAHRIRVSLAGMQPWTQYVEPSRGSTVFVHAQLEPGRATSKTPAPEPAPPPPPEAPATPEPRAIAPPVETPEPPTVSVVAGSDERRDVTFPFTGPLVLSARDQACLIPKTQAARMELDPTKTYRLWVEGRESLFYYLQGKDVPASDSSGVLTSKSRTVRHVHTLYAFTLVGAATPPSGPFKVRVLERGERSPQVLLVNPQDNAVQPDRDDRLKIRGLDPTHRYELTLKDGATPARLSDGKNGHAGHVLFAQNTEFTAASNRKVNTDDGVRALDVGSKYEVTGADHFIVFFADDNRDDNEGTMTLELVDLTQGRAFARGTGG